MSDAGIMGGWHEALEAGELRFPKCRRCASWNWYPLPRCRACGDDTLDWTPVEPRGVVHSWTRVHRAFAHAQALQVPYTVAIVEITGAAGVRLACLQRPEGTGPAIGDTVQLVLERASCGPRWTFAGPAA